MKMDKVANSKNDEFYTPKYAVVPILDKLEPKSKIWCPFDTKDSEFVKQLIKQGHNVTSTHIVNNQDFFKLINTDEYTKFDYIISNPPYSLKNEVLTALFNQRIPFAMLMGAVGIFESQKRFELFKNHKFELLIMNKRIDFFNDYLEIKPSKNPPFSTWYICSNILKNNIEFEEINKKDL